jgi:uncharacterized protein YegP (UPF0339 family)
MTVIEVGSDPDTNGCRGHADGGSMAGKYRFRLKAGNGEIIAVSEAYDTKASAKNAIASLQKNAPDATVVDLTE